MSGEHDKGQHHDEQMALCRQSVLRLIDDHGSENYLETVFEGSVAHDADPTDHDDHGAPDFNFIAAFPEFDGTTESGLNLRFVSSFGDFSAQSDALRAILDIAHIERVTCNGDFNAVALGGLEEAASGMWALLNEDDSMPLACMVFHGETTGGVSMFRLNGISREFAMRTMEDIAYSIITRNN